MSKFNFSNVLGGAVFGGLNAFLQHNASRDGYARPNRYEVVILLQTGVTNGSERDAGFTALSKKCPEVYCMVKLQDVYHFVVIAFTIPGRNLRTQMNGNIYEPTHQIVQGQTFAPVSSNNLLWF